LSEKLIPIIINNSSQPWVVAQQFTVKEERDVVTGFIADGNKFGPTCQLLLVLEFS
jgi:hypothetical protein